jgi:DNA-binding NtrC family response regulator
MQNVIERAAVLALDNVIRLGNMPTVFSDISSEDAVEKEHLQSFRAEREPHVSKVEQALIKRYLAEAGGNVSRAAQLANIPRRTFYRILEKHGLKGSGRMKVGRDDCGEPRW